MPASNESIHRNAKWKWTKESKQRFSYQAASNASKVRFDKLTD